MRIWPKWVIVGLILGIVIGLFIKLFAFDQESRVLTVHPRQTNEPLNNPFIGMAPPALNGLYLHPHRLV